MFRCQLITNYQLPITNYQSPITNYQLPTNDHEHSVNFKSFPSDGGGFCHHNCQYFHR
ncbi:MAG: hypothetical protein ACKO9I_06315 [Sphaerospermopsis kisseleviana]